MARSIIIRFTDGVSFDVSGPMRIARRHDGIYVVGQNLLIPVADLAEARAFIAESRKTEELTHKELKMTTDLGKPFVLYRDAGAPPGETEHRFVFSFYRDAREPCRYEFVVRASQLETYLRYLREHTNNQIFKKEI